MQNLPQYMSVHPMVLQHRYAAVMTHQWCVHSLREPLRLFCDFLLLLSWQTGKGVVFRSDQYRYSGLHVSHACSAPGYRVGMLLFARYTTHASSLGLMKGCYSLLLRSIMRSLRGVLPAHRARMCNAYDGKLTLLKPLACLYHSFTLFRVVFRVRSNIKSIATASLETRGSMETNSRWPPRSQIYCVNDPVTH